MKSKTLWIVLGPTGIGKTKLAIDIALFFNSEIISCDSRQFYKELNIGTAVPDKEDLNIIKHHFIQHKSIHDKYSVYDFEKDAIKKINYLFKKYNDLVMVGGSGLYIDAICNGIDKIPNIKNEIREKINAKFKNNGLKWLQNEVKIKDLKYYNLIDHKNPRRLIRFLEVFEQTGKNISSFYNKLKKNRPFKIKYIGLKTPREDLYKRINTRVDKMIRLGLVEEVKSLVKYKDLNALQTVGYKEIFRYFDGKNDLSSSIDDIKQNSRKYAKRQLTWMKRYNKAKWYNNNKDCIKDLIYCQSSS
tara:strand:+ start:351 stop:1256 length:906 start_codon:yes stop_codon:yes gene_type:complete